MKKSGIQIAVAALAILALEGVLLAAQVPAYAVPRPSEIGRWMIQNFDVIIKDTLITGLEAAAGLVIAGTLAAASFYAFAVKDSVRSSVLKIAATCQAVPILAVAPFLVAWFGPQAGSKIAAAVLICAPVTFSGIYGVSHSVSQDEMSFASRVYPNPTRFARQFLFPRSLPGFFGGLRVAAPLSVLGAIVGEFVGSASGLGFRILSGSYYLRTAQMAAAVLIAIVISLVLLGVVRALERRVVFWSNVRV